ncbi:MAG TPA: MMPL family transporter [Solirubrobacteraceae bacterium]|jgi:RND superfamily putative drug exporter
MATVEDRRTLDAASPEEPDTVRLSRLYRWGVAVARHHRAVLGISLLMLLVCAATYPALQKKLGPPAYQLKGSGSYRVEQILERRFPGIGSEDNALVFHSKRYSAGEPAYRAVIAAAVGAVRAQRGVREVVGPYDSKAVGQIFGEEHDAIALVALAGSPDERYNGVRAIQDAVTRAAGGRGVQLWLTGYSPIARDLSDVQKTDTARAQAIALPVTFVILLLALGALVPAMLPLLVAFAGLLLTDGVLTLLSIPFHFDSLLVAVVTMIGLGIGIDYSLFIVSRFREELARGQAREGDRNEQVADAIGLALATSGRTILFSGVIVALSLASLLVVDFHIYREIALGTVTVVVCMLVVAMTALPAVLAQLGNRINSGALPAALQPANVRAGNDGRRGGWARWALLVMRHPISFAAGAIGLLLVAAVPVLHLHYGLNVGVLRVASTPSGQGEKVLADTFSPGAIGPIQIVVSSSEGRRTAAATAAAKSLSQELERDSRIVAVAERKASSGVLLTAVATVAIDSPTSTKLVRHIRRDLAPPLEARGNTVVLVGGATAQALDTSNELQAKFPLILMLILVASLLFLLVVFRSVVLPIKAVLMNLLATAAAMGLVVLVFQDGHLQHLFNFTSTGFIQSPLPLIVFALLFGLSMDYEVFLIRRIQEEWRRTGENRLSVAAGIEHTARPITAAAAIMVAVFGSFITADLLEVKQIGFALATAIALDATLVRLVLVPAVMRLLGARNWWLPAWLARILPNLEESR